MPQINAEAGAQALFARTFNGTLFSTWEQQPEDFRDKFRETAKAVALATLIYDEPMLAAEDA